jgi:histidinol-phosphate aminotransferase
MEKLDKSNRLVWILDDEWATHDIERRILEEASCEVVLTRSSQFKEDYSKYAALAEGILLQVSFPLNDADISGLKKCRVISVTGGGYNNLDLEAATREGICATFVPGYCADEVSDHAMALILACARRIPAYQRLAKEGRWEATALGGLRRLRGQRLGLVGFGRIARKVASKAKAFGLEVCAHDPYVSPDAIESEGVSCASFEDVLKESDFISIHVLLTEQTEHLIDEASLRLVKPTAFLINTCRGKVVDEKALVEALAEGRLAGAALDVLEEEPPSFDNPLFSMENVIVTPHSAYISEEALEELKTRAAQNVVTVLNGEVPRDVINPEALQKGRFPGTCRVDAVDFGESNGTCTCPEHMEWSDLVRKESLELEPYIPGKPIEQVRRELGLDQVIKLASNETTVGPSPLAIVAAKSELDKVNFYPEGDSFQLRSALADNLGVSPGTIVVANGADNIITIVATAFLNEGDEIVIADPTFPAYESSAKILGAHVVKIPLKNYTHDLSAMKKSISSKTKMVVVCNPNNPTGTIVTRGQFEEFIQGLPERIIIVLDEAYKDYVEDSEYPVSTDYIDSGHKVIGIRTFSKISGLAGLRVGYAVAPEAAAELMWRVAEPFPVNRVAQAAGCAALQDERHRKLVLDLNRQGKAYLYAAFDRLGLEYVPTHTNFIFVNLGKDSGKVYQDLLKRGVIIRPESPGSVLSAYASPSVLQKRINCS